MIDIYKQHTFNKTGTKRLLCIALRWQKLIFRTSIMKKLYRNKTKPMYRVPKKQLYR